MSLALFHSRLAALIAGAPELAGITVLTETDADCINAAKHALLDHGVVVIIRGGDLAPMQGGIAPACALFTARVPVVLCIDEATRSDPSHTLAALTDAIIRAVHGQVLYETATTSSTIDAAGAQCVPMDDDGIQTVVVIFEAGVEYLRNN